MPGFEELEHRCIQWARAEEGIRAVAVLGSRSRTVRPADQWSDLDIVLFAVDPASYLSSTSWLSAMGSVWLSFIEKTAAGEGRERRALFEGGFDVDFAFFPTSALSEEGRRSMGAEVALIVARGMRILVDKDGAMEASFRTLGAVPPGTLPSEAQYLNVVNDVLYHSVWTAKKLRRGELWTAKGCSDDYMKSRLLRMIEWHARATNGVDCDTWHSGRFLEQWADPRIVAALKGAFASYDAEDLWRGLFATVDLFRWIAKEVSQKLGFAYPEEGDERATELTRTLWQGRGRRGDRQGRRPRGSQRRP